MVDLIGMHGCLYEWSIIDTLSEYFGQSLIPWNDNAHSMIYLAVHLAYYCSTAELSKLCMKVVDIIGSLRCIGCRDIRRSVLP